MVRIVERLLRRHVLPMEPWQRGLILYLAFPGACGLAVGWTALAVGAVFPGMAGAAKLLATTVGTAAIPWFGLKVLERLED